MATRLDPVAAVANEILWPAAQYVDQATALPWSHLEALAGLGLYGLAVPADQGWGCRPAIPARSCA
jgi:hypothetical protein